MSHRAMASASFAEQEQGEEQHCDAVELQGGGRLSAVDERGGTVAGAPVTTAPSDAEAAVLLAEFGLPLISHHLAHDLRSPLIRTQKFVELIREDSAGLLDEDVDSLFDAVDRAGQQSTDLLSRLNDCSMVATHPLAPVPVDLDRLMQDVLELCQPTLLASGLDVTPAPLGQLTTDPLLLQLLCRELITNACAHASAGHDPDLQIALDHTETGGGRLCFRDNGPGFGVDRPADLVSALELRATPDGSKGCGLGLTLCALVCRRLGFTLLVDASVTDIDGAEVQIVIPNGFGVTQVPVAV